MNNRARRFLAQSRECKHREHEVQPDSQAVNGRTLSPYPLAREETVLPGVSGPVEKAFAQMVVENGLRDTPIPLHRDGRDVEHLSYLIFRQSAEES
jgi:hypothetical protein